MNIIRIPEYVVSFVPIINYEVVKLFKLSNFLVYLLCKFKLLGMNS